VERVLACKNGRNFCCLSDGCEISLVHKTTVTIYYLQHCPERLSQIWPNYQNSFDRESKIFVVFINFVGEQNVKDIRNSNQILVP